MLKLVILTLFLLITTLSFARVEMRWLSVASVYLDDGKSRVMIDPCFTRPGLMHWLNLEKIKSNEQNIKSILTKFDIAKVNALLVSHSHFDHSVDAAMVAKITGATLYVDKSSDIIARAYRDPTIKRQLIHEKGSIQVGDFKIIPIRRDHLPIKPFGFYFMPGEVPADFDFDLWDYKEGENWMYYVVHPQGTILIDQAGDPRLEKISPFVTKADVLIQGVANRVSDENILNGYVTKFKPKIFIPTHYDNFFLDFKPEGPTVFLPFLKLEALMDKVKIELPSSKVVLPKFNEKIVLFE
jgi:L-ascorbate metabolism protein UlaG (beta-lactamase superfamily)